MRCQCIPAKGRSDPDAGKQPVAEKNTALYQISGAEPEAKQEWMWCIGRRTRS